MDEWLVSAGAAAQMLNISRSTFRLWIRDGVVPVALEVGDRRFFRLEDVRKIGLLISKPDSCLKRVQILGKPAGRKAPVKRRK